MNSIHTNDILLQRKLDNLQNTVTMLDKQVQNIKPFSYLLNGLLAIANTEGTISNVAVDKATTVSWTDGINTSSLTVSGRATINIKFNSDNIVLTPSGSDPTQKNINIKSGMIISVFNIGELDDKFVINGFPVSTIVCV